MGFSATSAVLVLGEVEAGAAEVVVAVFSFFERGKGGGADDAEATTSVAGE